LLQLSLLIVQFFKRIKCASLIFTLSRDQNGTFKK
jgi:hypothetical protein